jgi:aminoglycoside phosphotransferase family enzyme/predicted kinase
MSATKQGHPGQDQEMVLAFLSGHDPDCKRVDTHISIVFLGKDRVLKVKRAVQLPFLDFSTLEKRRHACEEELTVNRRFAPDIYRRIVPITQGHHGLEIGGDGPVIEWAVEMTRFDEDKTFDHLARAGHITPELAETLAVTIRTTHQRAEVSDGSRWLASIESIIDRNTQVFHNEPQLPRPIIDRLDAASRQRLADCRPLLQTRASEGLVRRCHGDAHLGNITLIDGSPVLFDAIEFDPVIATTDILYDLAFPIMDFCRFGLTACANRLFNGYLQTVWQESADALRLLPLFLSMRAAIRSNVLFTKLRLAPDQAHDAADAKAYFDLALRYIEPARPSLIAIGGKSGTGKSVLARETAPLLAPLPGAVLLRSDVIRKELFGVDPLVALPKDAYTAEVTARVYRTLLERSRQILSQGCSVVVDAAFLKQSERDELSMAAQKLDVAFHAVFLTADLVVRLDRIGARKADASDATAEIAKGQEDYETGRIDWPIVDASGSPEQTLQRSKAVLLQE